MGQNEARGSQRQGNSPFTGSEGSESETANVGAEGPKRILNVTLILKNGNSELRKEMSLYKDRTGPGENQAWPGKLEASSHPSGFRIFGAIKGHWDTLPDLNKAGVTKSSVANIVGSASPLSSLGWTRASRK